MEYKIDKNVAMPPRAGKTGKYPFKEMEVGDSVLIDKKITSLSPTYTAYGRRHNKKFVGVTEGTGTRVWRVE